MTEYQNLGFEAAYVDDRGGVKRFVFSAGDDLRIVVKVARAPVYLSVKIWSTFDLAGTVKTWHTKRPYEPEQAEIETVANAAADLIKACWRILPEGDPYD